MPCRTTYLFETRFTWATIYLRCFGATSSHRRVIELDELKCGLGVAMRTIKWPIIFLVSVSVFFLGVACSQMIIKPQVVTHVITETEYVPRYDIETVEIEREIEVTKAVYPTDFRQFESQEELSKWQAMHYLELQELGSLNNWTCVDYALGMQRSAWLDGYQMSTENLIDDGGKTGHAICSTWIGDECIYLEPQSTKSWVGAVRGDVALTYRPTLVYPESGQTVYREE